LANAEAKATHEIRKMKLTQILTSLYSLGMTAVLAGIIMHIAGLNYSYIVFGIGLIPVLGIRLYNMANSSSENHRKHLILVVSSLSLAAACVAIYYGRSYWVVFIVITVVLDFYISMRRFN